AFARVSNGLARGLRAGLLLDYRPSFRISRGKQSLLTGARLSRRRVYYCMERRITSWQSPALGMEMPLVAYGHAGYPVLMFPTAAADFLEYERFHLISSIQHLIESGRMRAYSINSVNRYSLMNEQAPPPVKAALLARYDRYITDEVLPLIRHETGGLAPVTTGASLGAYLAANTYF